ncbi:late exocytosis, associated with Golgi transport-domain-containing protein [Irpex lacteus]|nr:late exocytosis, associated with Golgi transport-domain-containing protein [Irpex lacteus]
MSNNGPGINNAGSASTSTFVTALVFNAIVFTAEIAAFTILRPKFPAIYSPRTFTPSANYHVQPIQEHWWAWPLGVFRANYESIQAANGLDAYFFVRFLWMIVKILLPIWPISWAVLMPIDAVKTGVAGNTGLDIFTFGNVGKTQQARYAAHLILAWLFSFWIMYNLRKEMKHFVLTRQRWLVDPVNANLAQSNTLLITGIPQKYLTEAAIKDLFSVLPGGVRKVWLNRDLKEMPDLYERQVKASTKLEAAETKLIKKALKNYNKQTKAANKANSKGSSKERISTDNRHLTDVSTIDTERNGVAMADAYVPLKQRPSHRLPPFKFLPFGLPFMGRKVDSIDWARKEVADTAYELERSRRQLAADVAHSSATSHIESSSPDSIKPVHNDQTYVPLNAAFILFNSQIGAHLAKRLSRITPRTAWPNATATYLRRTSSGPTLT